LRSPGDNDLTIVIEYRHERGASDSGGVNDFENGRFGRSNGVVRDGHFVTVVIGFDSGSFHLNAQVEEISQTNTCAFNQTTL
jgi:hypothetical protein